MNSRFVHALALLGLIACGSAKSALVAPATPLAPPAAASPSADDAPLPLRPEVTHGQLASGLRYLILRHQKPEKRALLWLAVDAGSVLEDDDQRGLAHFDEHMAFDGTARFKKTAIIDYLEKIGMRFGADLNAYTNFDQTVYQLEVPTDEPTYLTHGLDILRDWANGVTYEPAELERERGVVLEEWRLGRGAGQRLFDKQAGVLFKGSRYADRLTIGLPEIIKGAPREALLRFYRDFYRPDLMTVVVVGDVDPASIEAEINKRFADLQGPASPRARARAGQPLAGGTRVSIESDRELPSVQLSLYNLLQSRPLSSRRDYRRGLIEQLYSSMLSERLDEVRRRPDAPLRAAFGGISPVTREIDAFMRAAEVKGGNIEEALRQLFTEVLRVERRGFTATELERARAIVQRSYDEGLAREQTVSSRALIEELVRHALTGELVIGARAEDELVKELLPRITLDEVNQAGAQFGGPQNRVILIAGPDRAALPGEARVLQLVSEVEAQEQAPWVDRTSQGPLVPAPPAPGKIVAEKRFDSTEVTEWTLSNGVRVVVKPTDFEADSVLIQGFAPGGNSALPDAQYGTARFAAEAIQAGGVGGFDAISLGKALAGKNASAGVALGEQGQSVSGGGAARDLETILQLVHLRMTAPRRDPEAFAVWKSSALERLTDQQRSPEFQLSLKSAEALFPGQPRRRPALPEDLAPLELDRSLALYRDRFGDASGFTFVIVGAVELEKLRPLVEQWLASLPASGRKEGERDLKLRKLPGVVEKSWRLGEAPKASVSIDFHGDETWSRDKERDLYILGHVLTIRLREVLRAGLGGVYGVSAGGSLTRSPHQERSFSIRFGCDPDRLDGLLQAALAEVAQVAKSGASEELLGKVKQIYLRERETALRENGYWLGRLANAWRYGDDPALILDSNPMLARIASDNVAAAARLYLDGKQSYRAVRLPGAAGPQP